MLFTRKGYGRIYCLNPDDVQKVAEIIKELDDFEALYLPEDLIAPFSEYPKLAPTLKFCDLDLNKLVATCWARGIIIWCLDNGYEPFLPNRNIAIFVKPHEIP